MKKYSESKFKIGLILVILAFIVCVAVTVLKTADVDKILNEAESRVLAEMDCDSIQSHNNSEKFFDTKKEKAAICFVENKI